MTTELIEAIKSKDYDRAGRLASRDPGAITARDEAGLLPAVLALYAGREDLARALLPPDEGLTIFEAALFGRRERARVLLDAEPDLATGLSPDGFTALHLAVFSGDEELARLLIERGADIETASTGSIAPRVRPLHTAVFARASGMARLLLQSGADANSREAGGLTALHAAVENRDAEMVRLLVDSGADPALADDRGRLPGDLVDGPWASGVADLLRV